MRLTIATVLLSFAAPAATLAAQAPAAAAPLPGDSAQDARLKQLFLVRMMQIRIMTGIGDLSI